MGRQVHGNINRFCVEVHHNEYEFFICFAYKRELTTLVIAPTSDIGIGKVEELSFTKSHLAIAKVQHSGVGLQQSFLITCQFLTIEVSPIIPASQGIRTPVVENGGASVLTTESFFIHTCFAQLLSGIDHHRIGIHASGNHQSWDGLTGIIGKETRGNAQLIMIFEEVEHVFLDIAHLLPTSADGSSRLATLYHSKEGVVQSHLII